MTIIAGRIGMRLIDLGGLRMNRTHEVVDLLRHEFHGGAFFCVVSLLSGRPLFFVATDAVDDDRGRRVRNLGYVRMAVDALAVAMDAVFELVRVHGQLAHCPVRLFNRKSWVTMTSQAHFFGYLLGGL